MTKFKQFLAFQLSGCIKRRLSKAISFVGDPNFVFFEESTNRLDPDNRRQIWEVLAKPKGRKLCF